MNTDPSSTSTSAELRPDGAARKPTPIGLIGLTLADSTPFDERLPLNTTPPRRWRFAKYAMAAVLPVGVLFAAHRISEPEGLDAAEEPSSATAYVTAADSAPPAVDALRRPPARRFAADAFGHSSAVRVRVALPNDMIRLPLTFAGATDDLQMQWIGFDGKGSAAPAPWPSDGLLRAPARPGAFWLTVSRGGVTDTLADMALLVEHPMPNKMATGINGYHMGRWPKAADGIVPRGFIEVTDRLSDFPLSPHLRLSDFVVHDAQDGFPKYLHVRESVLDKVELIVAELAQMRGRSASTMKLNVASGFRSPAHNGELSGTASDSRHMYGDAADIAIDANNDGRLTEIDARLVAAAAEVVERKYPDLVGGVGLYITTDGAGWPYVHVDTRGHRARWRGGVRRGGKVSVDSLPNGATFDSVATAAAAPAAPAPSTAKPAATHGSPASMTSSTTGTILNPSSVVTTPSAVAKGSASRAAPSSKGRKAVRARPASSRRRSSPALIRASAAAHSRAVVRATPGPSSARTADDPFASAARKFRAARP